VTKRRHSVAGFTVIELMVTMAITGILPPLASSAMTGLRRQARASGQARLIVYRLQTARTLSVAQGWPQGYYFAGPGDGNNWLSNVTWCFTAGCGFAFKATSPTAPATYAINLGQEELPIDALPYASNGPLVPVSQLISVTALGVGVPSFTVGFDLNGLPNINPPPVPLTWPLCLAVQDISDASTLRYIIIFSDGTTRIQQLNETYCT
jgi:prepilin-type N-terminal cleavage/methylation domain-containing protein